MVDVVGLRFVVEGEQAVMNAIRAYRQSLGDLQQVQVQQSTASGRALQRRDTEERRYFQNFLRYNREKESVAQREARAQQQAAQQVIRATQRRDAEDRQAFQRYLRLQMERERAARETARAEERAAARSAQAAQRLAAERERLATQFNPLYAASKRYERAVKDLDRAHDIGVVGTAQYEAQLERLNAELRMGAGALHGQGAASMFASRRMNASGMAMQQVGYQAGDFLVQIQGGTNAFVAFGQQATQLVGILPMFGSVLGVSGTALIALSAGLGVVIPLLTAVGAAFMRTRSSADEATGGVRSFEDQLKSARGEIETTAREIERMNRGFETMAELTLDEAVRRAAEQVALARTALQGAEMRGDSGPGISSAAAESGLETARENLRLAEEQLRVFREQQARKERLKDLEEAATEEVRRQNEALEERASAVQRILATRDAEKQSLSDQLALLLVANRYGQESASHARLKRQQEEEAYRVYLEQNDILGNNQEAMVAIWRATQNAREESERTEAALSRIASLDMPITAKINALAGALGIAANEAARLLNNLPVGSDFGDPAALSGMDGIALLPPFAGPRPPARPDDIDFGYNPSADGSSDGGGSSTADAYEGLFPALFEAYEEAERLSKAYGEEVKILDSALEQGLITQQTYNDNLAQAQMFYNQTAEAASQYEDVLLRMADTASDAIGAAMMDIVTGTKTAGEAFSDMTQIILKKAFELLVINPILNSIFGGSGLNIAGFSPLPSIVQSANGNAFSGGSVVPFATGGVVSSPTLFPMSGGQTGLMGEAGAEAIMPLKRGAGGRLGVEASGTGGGDVTVNQYFSYAANGDDSVRQIIAESMPRIAAETERAVINSRRRGGVMRNTFAKA